MSSHHAITGKIHEESHNANRAAPGISYFTPLQDPVAGSAIEPQSSGKPIPKVFQPIKLRGITLQNRIMLSPLCQYSAEDGHHTPWHLTHLGGIIQRGPGVTCVEATAVLPEGRISPEDSGLWKDSQIEPLRKTVEFAHSQGQKIIIQLGHAGRKASTLAPWLSSGDVASKALNGWPDNVYGPSAIPYNSRHATPKEMTKENIENFKTAFVAATQRALKAGFDGIEIHAAHGYLLHQFLSPASNQRTDEYGGSFENRTRLVVEVVELARQTLPDDIPLFVRVSATDWLENVEGVSESWTLDQTIELAKILAAKGVDLLDVTSAGNDERQKIKGGPGYQAPFAKAIKKAVGDKMAVGVVGTITTGKLANELLEDGLDLAIVGRMFQKNPGLVFAWADELGVEVRMPNQIAWAFSGRGRKTPPAAKN